MPQKKKEVKSDPETNLVWIDLEMTGLDILEDQITQIATIITNENLEIIAVGPEITIHQPESVIKKIDRTNKVLNYFFEYGFIDEIRNSKVDLKTAEKQTIEFIKKHCAPQKAFLCGNNIHIDREFIHKHMPALYDYLHYKNINVTTIKELCLRWRPKLPKFEKVDAHQALQDIEESIEELKYYKKNFLKTSA